MQRKTHDANGEPSFRQEGQTLTWFRHAHDGSIETAERFEHGGAVTGSGQCCRP